MDVDAGAREPLLVRREAIAPDEGAWDGDACYKPFVLDMGGRWMLWYNGRREHKEQIGAAVLEGELGF